jgi:putative flippase GtrA
MPPRTDGASAGTDTLPAAWPGRLQAPRVRALVVLGLQYARFGIVGAAATLVHVLVYAGLIELLGAAPLVANTLGFAVAVNLSFVGHRGWTFRDQEKGDAGRSLLRFWIVALLGFALNTLIVWAITGPLGLAYGWAIPLMVGATPLATFTLSKAWAFRA